ncbi:hypothetical protein LV457_19820 [Mycobacterium sp. MYCO198283]|uniref:hypothetical protein n=1 Tax=Mycobacteriaceae TaxID=1762 RepID=UPI001E51ED5A|nr:MULTISPECIES: hypothetical protein [Mycobacteriaceae]MCG5434523.1 hypothetical protein [Mycobacterium sp. MYCO198283]
MPDGLDSLAAMRTTKTATSRRTLPPPRHQPRSTPVQMPEPVAPPPATPPVEQPPPPPPQAAVPPAGTDLTKASIYLDEPTDAYLETVRAAARTAKPRVDATRSAVVRLALNRLAEQFTPAEVVAELQRSAAAHSGPGRKRA